MVVIACFYNTELLAVQQEELSNEDLMELHAQRKDEERQEEKVTEKPKRFMMQEMPRGFSLFEEALLVFEAWMQNGTQRLQQLFRMHSKCYPVIYDEGRPRSFRSRGQTELNPTRNQNL